MGESAGQDDEVELEVNELEAVEPTESQPPPGRASVPPPVPPQARQRGPGSRSGTWRISQPPSAEGSSAGQVDAAASEQRIAALQRQLREDKAQIARLRLGNKLRDDRIAVLERELAQARARVAELEQLEARRPPDDLKRIDGIGPAYERALRGLGVRRVAEIAAWSDADVERIAEALGTQPSRVQPWIGRAAALG